ncbi:MAG TPA: GspE/PulE family protein [Rhodopila sp.]|uniref:GspE/PulE family protein n=1 Tax=Rhodopila sp. TaxID=2480087 RepID=UPI002C2852E6|nr:GspE/PulE family protein [Rhodopila sp.]HVY15976.1 GspE/PulE family protein [Rhodopila sp.]
MQETVTEERLTALGDILLCEGHCDERALVRARRIATESDQRVDSVLIQLGLVSERGLAEAYAVLLSTRIVAPERYPAVPVALSDQLNTSFLRHSRAVPIEADDDHLVLAMADPLDPFTQPAVASVTGRRVVVEIAVPIELEAALNRLYPTEDTADSTESATDTPLEEDTERLKDLASEGPVIRLVNQLITRAVEARASDIHIEPFEDRVRVRYRYDGVLQTVESPPRTLAAAITSRVKIMARLDIAERRIPQDGRIKMAVRGQDVDFRVSTIPSLHGETIVLRILDRSSVVLDFPKLGLAPAVVTQLTTALELPNGIILVTGPTGSGKTTTLYTGLLALNSETRKIMTVEDPIEYQLPGINQSQIHTQINLSFARMLRSILRQDPDIIMVGEIRDGETAQIAVQAALTGHLVLSTLHTNSAAAAVTRLRDMGLEDYLLTAVLRGIMAQRLIRRLCTVCRRIEPAPPSVVERFRLSRRTASRPVMIGRSVGCPVCRDTGFRGRMAVAEFLSMTPEIEQLIYARADHASIERAAVGGGMQTMFDAGLTAVLVGETTLEELVRAVGMEPAGNEPAEISA